MEITGMRPLWVEPQVLSLILKTLMLWAPQAVCRGHRRRDAGGMQTWTWVWVSWKDEGIGTVRRFGTLRVTLRDSLRSFRNRQVKGSEGTGSAEGLTRNKGACREPSGRSLVELMGTVQSWGVGCPEANAERTLELRESSV